MATCPACGEQNPDGFRFCGSCGRRLPAPSVEPREVRKTVTVVFVDLVGSTELGERLDPEPLREVVLRYYQRVASVLTRHGGTVAKFIGYAVMALFGSPVLRAAGRRPGALAAVERAVQHYERKGNVASAAKARSLLTGSAAGTLGRRGAG